MVKKIIFVFLIILLQFLLSCDNIFSIVYPEFSDNSMLVNASKLPEITIPLIEGIFKTDDKQSKMGDQIVLKFNKDKLSVFCSKSMDLFIMNSGVVDSGIVFEGWGRDLETTSVTLGRIFIHSGKGAQSLLEGIMPDSLIITFSLVVENQAKSSQNSSNFSYEYKFIRKLNENKNFHIIAHRAGARNSDLFTASENSLEMINIAESFGANGIEIDIRLSLDKIPVLFHDNFLSNRLVDGDILLGAIENYTLKHLKSFCRLKNGETIPTLEEALNEVLLNTKLNLVWLDIKSSDVIEYIIPIIQKYEELAIKNNRNIKFLTGITSIEVFEKIQLHSEKKLATICELDKQTAKRAKSKFWAPQWTLGYLNTDIQELENEEIQSLVWTLDDRKFIIEFLENSNYHGILSNYSPIVAYEYYIRN